MAKPVRSIKNGVPQKRTKPEILIKMTSAEATIIYAVLPVFNSTAIVRSCVGDTEKSIGGVNGEVHLLVNF
jgi:hypothetical protein